MASQPDVLQQCLQEVGRASRLLLERCVDQATAHLQAAELKSQKVADRDVLAKAWRHLLDHKPAWAARFPADLQAAFAQNEVLASDATRAADLQALPAKRSAPRRTGLEAFSLVDDADVAQAIESTRLLQQVAPRVEQALAELDTLMSSAQGLANVRPELNPLRPEVFTRVLQDLVKQAGAEVAVQTHWLKAMADPLGRELEGLYRNAIALLERSHVQAANYRVLQTPASAMGKARPSNAAGSPGTVEGPGGAGGQGGQGGGAGNSQGKPPSQYADLSNYEIRDELFQDFLFHGGSNAQHGLAPSYYASVDEELATLHATPDTHDSSAMPLGDSVAGELSSERDRQRGPRARRNYQDMPAVDRPPRLVDALSQLNSQVWGAYGRSRERAIVRTQLKKEATKVGQVLGLEVVRKLVNQVAQDPRLLVPVREAIVALEPSLLRLAMVDPRFFSDESHPGRRLMERVAQRSFKYNDEYSSEFDGFFKPVNRVFNELNALEIADAQPFGKALATLEAGWDEQDANESQNRRKVLDALRFAEDRQERADQIAFDLSARSDLEKVPGVVLDFLFGPWSLAMAHAKLTDERNQIDPKGYGSVVPDLLWSVKRDVTLKRPAKLIEMIPGLLDKLHSGLAMLGQTPQETEPFFESLMKLHQPVLKLRRLKSRQDAEESGSMPLELDEIDGDGGEVATPEQRRAKAAEQPWLGREDLDAAGFEDTLPTVAGELEEVENYLDSFSRQIQASALGELSATEAGLTPGAGAPSGVGALVTASGTGQANADTFKAAEEQAALTAAQGESTAATAGLPASVAAVTASAADSYTSAQAEAILMALRTNSWVDLYSKHRWLRAQLVWASTKATLFMFLSHGGQPHSMTKRSCEKLIMQRLLRPVDSQGVVAQALDAVAAEAAAQAASSQTAAVTQARAEAEIA